MKKTDIKVEYRPIAQVKPDPRNPRVHPPAQIEKIIALIKRMGWTNPILVDQHGTIVAGHARYLAARQMRLERVPVVELKGMRPDEIRAYVIADNRVAQESGWDRQLLATDFLELKGVGFDLSLTGFDPAEIEGFLAPPPGPDSEPPDVPTSVPEISRRGEIWDLGDHRLACGKAEDAKLVDRLMDGVLAQVVFTDPPYGVSYEANSGKFEMIQGDALRRGQLSKMLQAAFAVAIPHTREDAGWYVWHAFFTREDFADALRDVGLVTLAQIMWVKPGMVPGWSDYQWAHEPCFYAAKQGVKPTFHGARDNTTVWRTEPVARPGSPAVTSIGNGLTISASDGQEIYLAAGAAKGRKVRNVRVEVGGKVLVETSPDATTVWEVGRDDRMEPLHPTMKPVELARRALRNSSLEGEIVLDMFAGSSSTIMAAEQTGRIGRAIELAPQYVDVSIRRWQQLTGKQATHGGKAFDEIAAERGEPKARAAGKKAKAQDR